ncbi:MAG TPA: hypothetical protein VIF14_05460 [Alphaproteobacteria bacterium]|jgi:hypothetical protein
MMPAAPILALALLVAVPALARAETAARPVRVMEVVSVKVERLKEGDKDTHRITAIGKVPSAGWTNARLRAVRERHPNNAVAGFELIAVPPKKGAAQVVSEVTATLDTTIGAIQHTLIVRGRNKSVACTMTGEISCE